MKRTELVERFHLEETKLANFLMVRVVQGGRGGGREEGRVVRMVQLHAVQGGRKGGKERRCMRCRAE